MIDMLTIERNQSLVDLLLTEIVRNREIVHHYHQTVGPEAFGAHLIQRNIDQATRAIMGCDTQGMIREYFILKDNN